MREATKRRIAKLEQRTADARLRIVVTFPGDEEPESLPPGACHFQVVYAPAPPPEIPSDG